MTKASQDWRTFAEFVDALRSAGHPRLLLERLLAGLVELVGAERGFVLIEDKEQERLLPVAKHRTDKGADFLAISSTVYRRALERSRSVHIASSHNDKELVTAASLAVTKEALTIYCTPLLCENETLGVIYVDLPETKGTFTEERCNLFDTVAGLAAQLISSQRTRQQLMATSQRLQTLEDLVWEGDGLVVGESQASKRVDELIRSAAPQDVTVLITGETGTGKEMVARAIHKLSPRKDEPFIAVNCAALPRDLLEAELFGAEKGAYTGATGRRLGRFELAGNGTLFLDEIGELPLDTQVSLLRVLQERKVTRLGGSDEVNLHFRLICATNANLEEAIQEGTFRRDFFYRINVFQLALVPLRNRPEDILLLANHFLETFNNRYGRKIRDFSLPAKQLLTSHIWPGNIRELRNAIERAVVIESGKEVCPDSLPIGGAMGQCHGDFQKMGSGTDTDDGLPGANFWAQIPQEYESARQLFEKTYLERTIQIHKGNVSAMAKTTGLPRSTLYRRMKKYGIEIDS